MGFNGNTDIAQRFLTAKRALFDKLYAKLNSQQRQAIFTVNGPLLVLAGAGSGKTTVLTKRIAFIIKYGNAYYSNDIPDDIDEGVVSALEAAINSDEKEIEHLLKRYAVSPCPPWAIMSITFTNKAANEMKARLINEVGEAADGSTAEEIWAGTFHSICLRLLRKYTVQAGLRPGFTVYDTDDCKRMITRIIKDLGIDEKVTVPKTVLNNISSAKNRLLSPEEYAETVKNDFVAAKSAKVYAEYQKLLSEANVVDFDDIIMRTVVMLRNNPDIKNWCNHRYRYICVDEYQDTNDAQFRLICELTGSHNNLMVVGDDDQSIYRFRGANIENILGFDKIFNDTKTIRLEQNYRSTSNILGAANAVIANNQSRKGKTLFTDREGGEKVILKKLENQNEEARYIVNKINEHINKEGRHYNDFAVLYRMNAQSSAIEQIFVKSGIPYRVLGGMRFFERKEIKDIVAYLCVVNNTSDNLRLRRIINEPKRKIGETTMNAVEVISDHLNVSMFSVMEKADEYKAIEKYSVKLMNFAKIILELRRIAQTEPISVLVEKTIELSGYRTMLLEGTDANLDKLETVQELVSVAAEYEKKNENPTLEDFLEEIALFSDVDNYDQTSDAVVLMTIHSAKGLEFPIVFIPGCEEGIFPGLQASFNAEELEEERRLAYVAITRAKDCLYCSHVRERMLFGRTQFNHESRFIKEIPEEYIDSDYLKRMREAEKARSERVADGSAKSSKSKKPAISKEFFKDAESTIAESHRTGSTEFQIGDIVSHVKFGRGEILSATEMGGDVLYEIAFDDFGTRKLMATYARLKKV